MSNKNLSEYTNYPASAISVYDVISSYLVDLYYNYFYAQAIKFRDDKRVPSISEGYRHAIYAFIDALDHKAKRYNAKNYSKILTGITDYFRVYTAYTAISVSECIDKIIKEFAPSDYYPIMTKERKRGALRDILMAVIKEFSKIVVGDYIEIIIDAHEQTENIQILKDQVIDLFIIQRDLLYRKFLNIKINPKGDVVDRELAVKMREDLARITKENKNYANSEKTARELLEDREQTLKKLIVATRKMQYDNASLRAECDALKSANTQSIAELKRVKDERVKWQRGNQLNQPNQNASQGNQNASQGNQLNQPAQLNQNASQGNQLNQPAQLNQNASQGNQLNQPAQLNQNASQLNQTVEPDDDALDNEPASKILERRKKTVRIANQPIVSKNIFDENNSSLDEY